MKKMFKSFFLVVLTLITLISCSVEGKSKEVLSKEMEVIKQEKFLERDDFISNAVNNLLSDFTYTIGEAKENGENSEVKMDIKRIDIKYYLTDMLQKMVKETFAGKINSEDEFNESIVDYLTNIDKNNIKYSEKSFNVKMQKVNGEWKLSDISRNEIMQFMTDDLKGSLDIK